MPRVIITRPAQRSFERLSAENQKKVDRCFDELRVDPRRSNNAKPLKGEFRGLWRYRVGIYRVIYRILDGEDVVQVVDISNRSDAYD